MATAGDVEERPSICVGCGLCCDGTLFRSARLTDTDDRAPLEAVPVRILSRSDGSQLFELPCGAFGDRCCTIYERRPLVCREYTCRLYKLHQAGGVSYEEATSLIALTLDVRDRLRPQLEVLLDEDERAVLEELYRTLLGKFDRSSIRAHRLSERLETAAEDDVSDLLPAADLHLRRPDLTLPGSPIEVQRRRFERVREHEAAGELGPPDVRLASAAEVAAASHTLGDYSAAARYGQDVAELTESRSGPDAVETLAARECLAWWVGMSGRPIESLAQQRRLLADRVRALGPDHPDTLASRRGVAEWTGVCGEPQEARALMQGALADRQRVLGPDDLSTLSTRHSVAFWTGACGEGGKALELYRELLADRMRVQGPEDPDVLATRAAVAYWTGREGDPQEAVALTAAVLLDRIRRLGADHVHSRLSARAVAYWTRLIPSPDPPLDPPAPAPTPAPAPRRSDEPFGAESAPKP